MLEDDLRDEVDETTAIYHEDLFARLREQVSQRGIAADDVVVGGFMESEECQSYWALVRASDQTCWYLEGDADDRLVALEQRDADELARDFPAVPYALEAARKRRG